MGAFFYGEIMIARMAFKIGHIPWNKGKKVNIKHDKQFKKGMIPWNKGLKAKDDIRIKKIVEAAHRATKGKPSKNRGKKITFRHGMLGKHHSEESKEKMRKPHYKARGINNWKWKGGTGTERHQLMGKYEYIKWRSMVFERDNYTCQDCGVKGVYLMAHHKKPWTEYPELRYELINGITYCKDCHAKNDKYYSRFYQRSIV